MAAQLARIAPVASAHGSSHSRRGSPARGCRKNEASPSIRRGSMLPSTRQKRTSTRSQSGNGRTGGVRCPAPHALACVRAARDTEKAQNVAITYT